MEDVPFVGACTVSFLKPPDFDFDLNGLGNALSIPGVSLLLRHVIQDQLEQTIVMPNSLTISLVQNIDNITNSFCMKNSEKAWEFIYNVYNENTSRLHTIRIIHFPL